MMDPSAAAGTHVCEPSSVPLSSRARPSWAASLRATVACLSVSCALLAHAQTAGGRRPTQAPNRPVDAADFSGFLHIPVAIAAFIALFGVAVYLYHLLQAAEEKEKAEEPAPAGGVQPRGSPSTQQQARRRRLDRSALESLIAAPQAEAYTQAEGRAGDAAGRMGVAGEGGAPGAATAAGAEALTAAQRRREEREARREERRQQQGQRQEREENSDGDAPVQRAAPKKGETYRLRQLEREKERQRREEEEQRKQEEKRRQEEDEYNKWKAMFAVEESGEMARDEEEENRELERFINFIKVHKMTELDDLAAEFGLHTKDVVQRIRSLEDCGRLSGVLDDRGKYFYITEQELDAVADFLRSKGRIHKEKDLVPACNRIIRLQPTEEDKRALKEEERRAMNLIDLTEDADR
ncbi:hypothetical protein BESB_003530 [Besnoitia besnoiti]|uniref:DDRGK domain-containing protein 1 n=1 Tax=Besnoitia besnoiti TaxID=94643 RepID=A0A2A9MQ25_BESBE|nr:hypothetical protein BESB_003530 [Besnoitia besnoiti]PFH38012.1 hypothetical protein BESB_003530 [Besnoitia besnoiti]